MSGADESGDAASGSDQGTGKSSSRVLVIGLVVVAVLVLAVVAFFALWDFQPSAPGDAVDSAEPVPAETNPEPGVSQPSASGA
jgi:hypothetical protein